MNLYYDNSDEYIQGMRKVGGLTSKALDFAGQYICVGISTEEIDRVTHGYIEKELKCNSAPLAYENFPKAICISVNDVACHGIPNRKKLKRGDIVNIDISLEKDGYFGDSARMYYVGEARKASKRLCEVAKECLYSAIDIVMPGTAFSEIGKVVNKIADEAGYSIVEEFGGHGIGYNLHQLPEIIHYRNYPVRETYMEEGMTFTIEPILNIGSHEVYIDNRDGWGVKTVDGSLSAQWEHTLLVTSYGCEILTI